MSEDEQKASLLARAAEAAGVTPALLEALLALDDDFPDFTVYGAKTNFSRKVAEILDAAAAEEVVR